MRVGEFIRVTKEWRGTIPSPVTVGKSYRVVATHLNPNVVNIIDDEGDELELKKEYWEIDLTKKDENNNRRLPHSEDRRPGS